MSQLKKEESSHFKSINKFQNLRSDYFLSKVMNNLEKKKLLEIIKYNKKFQKRLNISIINYKEFSENYSSIEIEIIPFENKTGRFIKISNIEDAEYYHIYFNNNKKEEIKRTNLTKKEKISKINIIINYQIVSFNQLFSNCNCIKSIHFKKLFRNNITDMSYMFDGCSALKEINFSNFNTNNVKDMSYMFWGCASLEELNLDNFNIDNVIDMSFMFDGCSSLKKLNIWNFKINETTNIYRMFSGISDNLKIKIKEQFNFFKEEAFL